MGSGGSKSGIKISFAGDTMTSGLAASSDKILLANSILMPGDDLPVVVFWLVSGASELRLHEVSVNILLIKI